MKSQAAKRGFDIGAKIARQFSKLSFKSRQYAFDIEQKTIE
ncbi:uncharacterized protein METZ01_LOCUS212405, partial [marine metagenome]